MNFTELWIKIYLWLWSEKIAPVPQSVSSEIQTTFNQLVRPPYIWHTPPLLDVTNKYHYIKQVSLLLIGATTV